MNILDITTLKGFLEILKSNLRKTTLEKKKHEYPRYNDLERTFGILKSKFSV